MITKNHSFIYIAISFVSVLSGCGGDDPQKEDVPELITKATLTFTPPTGSPVVVTATDPDGEGVQNIKVDGTISLVKSTTYVLTIQLINGLAAPTDDEYDITREVNNEGDEHMFFFGWTANAFSDPSGDGNIDARADVVNYTGGTNSKDVNGLPLGLTTTWKTSDVAVSSSAFHVMLMHQPGLKSATSDSKTGENDLDVTFVIEIK